MLIVFYSTLIIFLILFTFTMGYLASLFKRKKLTSGNALALCFFLLLSGIISGIYGFDYIKLQAGELTKARGKCTIEYDDGGRSISTTTIKIDGKTYHIKGDTYSDLPDGTYQCTILYLPVTKIVEDFQIEND